MPTGFDVWAPQFDGWRGPADLREIEAIHELLGGARRVLDAGGGTGRYAEPLVRLGHRLTLFDRSQPMMKEASKKGLVSLVRGDATRLPFSNGSFDGVLFVEMLHLVNDWARAVHEMGRVAVGPIVAVVRERVPDHRKVYLKTRTEMGMPTGKLDEGVRALVRMLPPLEVREVWRTQKRVDLEEPIRSQESQAAKLGEPLFPEVARAALSKVVRKYGSTTVDQVETVEVARWEAGAFQSFTPPPVPHR